jgi:hypothetical protein
VFEFVAARVLTLSSTRRIQGDRCEARFAFPRQAYEVSRVDVVKLCQLVFQFVVTASASLQRSTSPLWKPGELVYKGGVASWKKQCTIYRRIRSPWVERLFVYR